MKALITLAIVLTATQVLAFTLPTFTGDIPSEDGWAKAMTSRACDMKFASNDVGTIDKSAKNGVVYTVYNLQGEVLASAWARSTFIGARKKCLLK
jgi:hypothetical protein